MAITSTITFLQSTIITTDTNAYTFAAQNLGTAATDRIIIVCLGARMTGVAALSVSSVTVAGVTATPVVTQAHQSTNSNIVGIYFAFVPTGTSGSVVVTYSQTMLRSAIALYSATQITGEVFDTAQHSAGTAEPSLTFDLAAKGIAVTVAMSAGTSGTWTWDDLTEDCDFVLEGAASGSMTTASSTIPSNISNFVITGTYNQTNVNAVGAAASFRPPTSPGWATDRGGWW